MTLRQRRRERKQENKQIGKWLLLIFGALLILNSLYLLSFAEYETTYEYSVKAEQVYDNDRIEESVKLQSLSHGERAVLYDAFKNSDEFLGSSESTIRLGEKFDTFDGWKIVEFQGVYILVAIEGPSSMTQPASIYGWLSIFAEFVFIVIALFGLKQFIFPSAY